ncbi:vWA domain-containing protein [Stakelama tenebrarum]|nr:VWA domain-containing protein [Sphingosinithalassobacter tenebrarum]
MRGILITGTIVTTLLAGCSPEEKTQDFAGPPPMPAYVPNDRSAELMVAPQPYPTAPQDRERYEENDVSPVHAVGEAPVSTFSVDVDTGSYTNSRRFLTDGRLPPQDAVRTEEFINYFRYDYPLPEERSQPFSVTTNVTTTPWNANTRLLRIGLRGYDIAYDERPAANLTFLIDVSGSMATDDKLGLVKTALSMLADGLRPQDKVSIVVYSGAAGIVLEPTNNPDKIKAALEQLSAGGSTAGGQGIALAYATARSSFIENGINRIIVATDGDFNVGVTDQRQLEDMVERNRDSGITLTTLGFGRGNYNEALMESIADLGNGNYAYIDSAMEAQKVLDEELSSTLFTIAGDVKIQVEFNPAHVSEYRLIGYENRALREEDFENDKVDAGDIGAGHQVTAIYEIVPAGAEGWLPERRYEANRPQTGAGGDELAFVKLRYKLPGQDTSRLIERPVPASAIAGARAPQGDMAFAVAVAAFGQKLRGDTRLGDMGWSDIRALAGNPQNYWRQEFVKLVGLASAHSGERRAAD